MMLHRTQLVLWVFVAVAWSQGSSAQQNAQNNLLVGSDLVASVNSVAANAAFLPEVIQTVLDGDEDLTSLQRYLTEPLPDRIEITGRCVAVVDELNALSLLSNPGHESFYDAARIVRDVCIRSIFSVPVSRLTITRGYVPTYQSYVWDFGGGGSKEAPGFNRLMAGDPGVAGFLEPYSRLGAHLLSGDGLAGVREFKTEIANGRWRVTLIGDAPVMSDNRPAFGGEVIANGVSIFVADFGPDEWLPGPLMTSGGRTDSFGEDFQKTNQALVVQFEADVFDGLLAIQFLDDAAISGLIIEPSDTSQSVTFHGPSTNAPILIDEALALASLIDARLWRFSYQRENLMLEANDLSPIQPYNFH